MKWLLDSFYLLISSALIGLSSSPIWIVRKTFGTKPLSLLSPSSICFSYYCPHFSSVDWKPVVASYWVKFGISCMTDFKDPLKSGVVLPIFIYLFLFSERGASSFDQDWSLSSTFSLKLILDSLNACSLKCWCGFSPPFHLLTSWNNQGEGHLDIGCIGRYVPVAEEADPDH